MTKLEEYRGWRMTKAIVMVIMVIAHGGLFFVFYSSSASLCYQGIAGWLTNGCTYPFQTALKVAVKIFPFTLLLSAVCYLILRRIARYVIGDSSMMSLEATKRKDLAQRAADMIEEANEFSRHDSDERSKIFGCLKCGHKTSHAGKCPQCGSNLVLWGDTE